MQNQILAAEVGQLLLEKGLTLGTAESCTGGAIGAVLTSLAGSSSWFNGGVISYSNNAKIKLLGVPADSIKTHGAVSQEVVESMAIGGCEAMEASVCVAVSGIAGPGGGAIGKPVGTVWIAWCQKGGRFSSQRYHFSGTRQQIQSEAVSMALKGIVNLFK